MHTEGHLAHSGICKADNPLAEVACGVTPGPMRQMLLCGTNGTWLVTEWVAECHRIDAQGE
jgi:hypothetical protein